ncbi:MAG: AmmeMemoRadiSam system radical SAM enzyme [Sedimentisphaerales bacterium]|nr:AmmeMemoRadiSam system radical SAM enzyme [Sedimentisphaerales bacterium]
MNQNVQCELCPKRCVIGPGQSGDCRVRINIDGVLRTVVYGYPCSMNIDPIEKKPLFHFLPGTPILSLATVGCNLHCLNCQNWEISQCNPEDSTAMPVPPEQLVKIALQRKCPSIAYTYTDPIVYYEYAYDTSRLARQAGIRNALVTAGYCNPEPWRRLLEVTDAARIDLKGMSDDFYRKFCSGTAGPVKQCLIDAVAAGVHVEVINLIIPTLNDKPEDIRQLARWVKGSLGNDIPLHFSGFYPHYKMQHLPPTPLATLDLARHIALEEGLYYVYIGNIRSKEGENTYCPSCKKMLIQRQGFMVVRNILKDGCCPDCGRKIYGVWK